MFHGLGYIGGLCRFVATTQHRKKRRATLNVMHAPIRAEVCTHFKHALAYKPHVNEVARRRLAQSRQQTAVCHPIRKTEQPSIKVFSLRDPVWMAAVRANFPKCAEGFWPQFPEMF